MSGQVRVLNVKGGAVEHEIHLGSQHMILAVAVSNEGSILATLNTDGTIEVFHHAQQQDKPWIPVTSCPGALTTANENTLEFLHKRRWRLTVGSEHCTAMGRKDNGKKVLGVRWKWNKAATSASTDGPQAGWCVAMGRPSAQMHSTFHFLCIGDEPCSAEALSFDGDYAVCAFGGIVTVYAMASLDHLPHSQGQMRFYKKFDKQLPVLTPLQRFSHQDQLACKGASLFYGVQSVAAADKGFVASAGAGVVMLWACPRKSSSTSSNSSKGKSTDESDVASAFGTPIWTSTDQASDTATYSSRFESTGRTFIALNFSPAFVDGAVLLGAGDDDGELVVYRIDLHGWDQQGEPETRLVHTVEWHMKNGLPMARHGTFLSNQGQVLCVTSQGRLHLWELGSSVAEGSIQEAIPLSAIQPWAERLGSAARHEHGGWVALIPDGSAFVWAEGDVVVIRDFGGSLTVKTHDSVSQGSSPKITNSVFHQSARGADKRSAMQSCLISDWETLSLLAAEDNEFLQHHLRANPSLLFETLWPVNWTLLHLFSYTGNTTALEICFSLAGDQPMGLKEDCLGRTALDICLQQGHNIAAELLLERIVERQWPAKILECCTDNLYQLLVSGIPGLHHFLDSCFGPPIERYPGEVPTRAGYPLEKLEKFVMFEGGSQHPWMDREEYEAFIRPPKQRARSFMSYQAKARSTLQDFPVEVQVLYLQDMMQHNSGVLQALVDSVDDEIFKSQALNAVLTYKWKNFGKKRHSTNTIVYFCYLGLLSIAAPAIAAKREDLALDSPHASWQVVCVAMLSLSLLNLIWREVRQMWKMGLPEYLYGSDAFWNWWQLLTFILGAMIISAAFFDAVPEMRRPSVAVLCTMSWMLILFYLRGYKGTGPLVRMVTEVLKGMRYFLLLIGVVQIAFAQGFWILLEDMDLSDVEKHLEKRSESELVLEDGAIERALKGSRHHGHGSTTDLKPFATMPLSLLYAYRISLIGEYDPSIFLLFDASHCALLGYFFFVICTLLLTVVFLNLLISLISDIFQKVQERHHADAMRERASLLLEEEQLMSRSAIMNSGFFPQYLYVAQHTSARLREEQKRQASRKKIMKKWSSRETSKGPSGAQVVKISDMEDFSR
eukprot:gnl/MRDRNA2_/MRDRNA2_30435_c0_seq1.p1 gnl/MRDRNA2_/MRDRNA2_30435_c0~~gnl/MRDRNA2_/MRDRNA2_30435_c0_seq1.p1  ORF type:complete len:1183 (-),score=192.62 gnl/MRDRNA2_/MRDRNA2_30435_c0_seq1:214-3570(-)